MRKSERNELRRLMDVQLHLEVNADVMASNKSVRRAYEELSLVISELHEVIRLQMMGSKATTTTKNAQRKQLCEVVLRLAGHLMGVAEAHGDAGLKVNALVFPSRLRLMPDEDLAQKAVVVLEEARLHQDALLELEGITADDLAGMEAELEAFSELIGSPRAVIRRRKVARTSVPELLKRGRRLLRLRLGRVLMLYKESAPVFYAEYVEATKLKRVATRSAALHSVIGFR